MLRYRGALGRVLIRILVVPRVFGFLGRLPLGEVEVAVQRMAGRGREVILGGKRDKSFGPVVLFGLGGIFVEVFQDAVWRLAPIRHEEAGRMIQGIRGARVLAGYRGVGPSDVEAVQDLLVRLSQMLASLPGIQEIDINPVMVLGPGEGAQALDARVILG
jgi:acyl-CoA synthetase (NDP forming)